MRAGISLGQYALRCYARCRAQRKFHAHHRSRSFNMPEALSYGRRQRHPAPGEAVYRHNNLNASYLHLFFPSNPKAISRLFNPE